MLEESFADQEDVMLRDNRYRLGSVMGFQGLDLCRSFDHLRLHQRHPILLPEPGCAEPDRPIPARQPPRCAAQ